MTSTADVTAVEIFFAPSLWFLLGFVLLWFWMPVIIGWFWGRQIERWWVRYRLFTWQPQKTRFGARVEAGANWLAAPLQRRQERLDAQRRVRLIARRKRYEARREARAQEHKKRV